MRELNLSPGHPDGWARLAVIDALSHRGALTPAGVEALRRSYAAAPFEWRFHLARARFGYEHWPQLPSDVRAAVERETVETLPLSGHSPDAFVASIGDRSGAFAARLAILIHGVSVRRAAGDGR